MANFIESPQSSGVMLQIQEIIANYISNLEAEKIEASKKAEQSLEIAKQELVSIEIKKQSEEEKAAKIELKWDNATKENEVVEKKLVENALKLKELNDEIKIAKESLIIVQEAKKLSDDGVKENEETVKKLKKDAEDILADIELKKKTQKNGEDALTVVEKSLSESVKKLTDTESSVLSAEKKLKTVNDSIKLTNEEIEIIKNNKKVAISETEVEKNTLDGVKNQIVEAKKELLDIQNTIKVHNDKMSEEKLANESDKMFNEQAAELIKQTNSGITFVKEKLKEIILKLDISSDGSKHNELKNLLFTVEKL